MTRTHRTTSRTLVVAVVTAVVAAVLAVVGGTRATATPSVLVLDELPGTRWSRARAVNDLGHVVGSSVTETNPGGRPTRWDPAGRATELEIPAGSPGASAFGITDSGFVIGGSGMYEANEALLWAPDGRLTELEYLPGGIDAGAGDVTDGGLVVGFSKDADGVRRAVRRTVRRCSWAWRALPGRPLRGITTVAPPSTCRSFSTRASP